VQDAVLIPAQIYSSFLLLVIFLALRLIQEGRHKAGEVFLFYLLFYSLKRFFIEFWRADNPAIWGGLTLFQIFSAAVFFFAVAFLFKLHGKGDGYKKA
jgi:phosphatidylglycerol:prolipoprotein diacylglycerol transferase